MDATAGIRVADKLFLERIHRITVHTDFKMEMWTCRVTGAADIADHFAGRYILIQNDCRGFQVAI
jgi:hypothetical protein